MAIGYADKDALMQHYGHELEIALYGYSGNPDSVTIECIDCGEVLIDTPTEEDDEDLFDEIDGEYI